MGKATFGAARRGSDRPGPLPGHPPPCIVATQASLPDAQARFGTLTEIAAYLGERPQLGASVIFYGAAIPDRPVFGA